jgi:NADPH-dependent glutamate synthase beta subunit-like oxidoreductase
MKHGKMQGYGTGHLEVDLERFAGERLGDQRPRLIVLTGKDVQITGGWCGNCHSSTCQEGAGSVGLMAEGFALTQCPLRNDIPGMLAAAARGDLEQAYRIDARTNDIGDVTGAACPSHRLCGGGCMLLQVQRDSKHIAPTEAAVFENAWDKGLIEPIKMTSSLFGTAATTTVGSSEKLQVSMIGAGVSVHRPIQTFLEFGANVTVYDEKDVPGGITHWGIPGTKLDRNTYRRHTERFKEGGACYVLNTRVGNVGALNSTYNHISFEEVAEKSDIVFIGTGLQKRRTLPTEQLSPEKQASFMQSVDFIEYNNCLADGRPAKPKPGYNVENKDIALVGSSDTAWDVVALALRGNVNKITMLVRGKEMNGLSAEDVERIQDLTEDEITDIISRKPLKIIKDNGEEMQIDKEIRSGIEEAAYLAHQRGRRLKEVLDIRMGTEIIDKVLGDGVEELTLQDLDGNESLEVHTVFLALGSIGEDVKSDFGFSNDNFKMHKGGRLPVTPYYTPEQRRGHWGYGSGLGGGLVGIYQTASGRKVPVFGVGDITRIDRGLDWSDEKALIVTAYRDGVNVTPDAFAAAQDRESFIQWAEKNGLTLNYSS